MSCPGLPPSPYSRPCPGQLSQLTEPLRGPTELAKEARQPAVTAKSLARHLRITPQAALRLLVALAKAGVVRETTGRRSFRAFAI